MDKKTLEEYIDACMLVKETEEEIQRLEQKKMPAILGKVKGSSPDFPYQARSFTISGTAFGYGEEKGLREQKQVLMERKARAEKTKLEVERWMNIIPMRMQRIIKYKILEEMTWEETAAKIGGKETGEGVRKQYERFFEKK